MSSQRKDIIQNFYTVDPIQDLLFCQICFELNLPDRKPLFCTVCEKVGYCESCWNQSQQRTKRCPNCRTSNPEYKYVSQSMTAMRIMHQAKLFCKNKDIGCNEVSHFFDYPEHLKECGSCQYCGETAIKSQMKSHQVNCLQYPQNCYFCQETLPRQILGESHNCLQMHCLNGDIKTWFYSQERYKVDSSQEALLDAAKCKICNNILRDPRICTTCDECYCSYCATKNKMKCVSCTSNNKMTDQVNRILKEILSKVQIKCNYCKEYQNYWKIEKHEQECRGCPYCKEKPGEGLMKHMYRDCNKILIQCVKCKLEYPKNQYPAHDCDLEAQKKLMEDYMNQQRDITYKKSVTSCFKGALTTNKELVMVYLLILIVVLGDHISQLFILINYSINGWGAQLIGIGMLQDYVISMFIRIVWLISYKQQQDESLLQNQETNAMTFPKFAFGLIFSVFLPYSETIIHNGLFKVTNSEVHQLALFRQRVITSYARIVMIIFSIGFTDKDTIGIFEICFYIFAALHIIVVWIWTFKNFNKWPIDRLICFQKQ